MSDPLIHHPAEDVLASIRRLVAHAPQPVAVASRLLLTPALRVVQDEGTRAEPLLLCQPVQITADLSEENDQPLAKAEPLLLVQAAGSVMPRRVNVARDTAWADAAEAEVLADLARQTEDRLAEDVLSVVVQAPSATEELRETVRALIREELAGSLGERMTQNIRKLVRAEIARELAMRELE